MKRKKKRNEKQNINSFKEIVDSLKIISDEEKAFFKKIQKEEIKKMYKNIEENNEQIKNLSKEIANEIFLELKKENKLKEEK